MSMSSWSRNTESRAPRFSLSTHHTPGARVRRLGGLAPSGDVPMVRVLPYSHGGGVPPHTQRAIHGSKPRRSLEPGLVVYRAAIPHLFWRNFNKPRVSAAYARLHNGDTAHPESL